MRRQQTAAALLVLAMLAAGAAARSSAKPAAAAPAGAKPGAKAASPAAKPAASKPAAKPAPAGAAGSSPDNPVKHTLDITVGSPSPAPDCFERKVVLVNGQFMPTLELTQGDWVEITVENNIPKEWPALTNGLTIHWHGFSMKGFPFQDGTRFVSQCPIAPGTSFTHKFQVNEMPGTYFWHDHAAMYRADGLQGALIVRPRPGAKELNTADEEDVLFLHDWNHFIGNAMAMRLNRPFDPAKATSDTGSWCWVGLPKAILINGRGNYYDCEDVFKREVGKPLPFRPAGKEVVAAEKDLMLPNGCVAGQLGPKAEPSMCSVDAGAKGPGAACAKRRAEVVVTPSKTMRLRLINAAMLVYMTVCFEKHTVTVVALDAAPVTPKEFKNGCVDVNTGQRVDVLLKADQPVGSYWISVASQYRKGAPTGYAVLRYKGSSAQPNPATIVQPGPATELKWNTAAWLGFTTPDVLLSPAKDKAAAAPYVAPANSGLESWKMPQQVDKRYVIQATQPLLDANGILRWALDSVAHAEAPPCKSVIQDVHEHPTWAAENALTPKSNGVNPSLYFTKMGGSAKTWVAASNKLQVIDVSSPNKDLLNDLKKPGAGSHVLTVEDEAPMIEIVIQNNRAGLYGGEYASKDPLTDKRNGREQHAFHLHGYHFWLVGMGDGQWRPDMVGDSRFYNLANPHMRDSATVLFNGTTEDRAAWVAFRFRSDNPGVWPLHCHIAWHEIMGQGLNVISHPKAIAKLTPPDNLPSCPSTCVWDFANTNPKAAASIYGKTGLLAPESSNLP